MTSIRRPGSEACRGRRALLIQHQLVDVLRSFHLFSAQELFVYRGGFLVGEDP